MRITVLGAGNSGLAFVGHLASEGHQVTLWNRSFKTIETLMETKQIHVQDQVQGTFLIHQVTTDLQEAVLDAELIVIATPQYAHQELANQLSMIPIEAPILLSPGGIFGVILFDDVVKSKGLNSSIVVGTQTVIYTSRKQNADTVNIMKLKNDVYIAGRHYESKKLIYSLVPECMQQHLYPVDSLVITSISDINMIVHCAPMLLNVGWIEHPEHQFLYYHEGFSPSIAEFATKVDDEKLEVGRQLGYELESTYEWIKRSYGIEGQNLYECFHTNPAFRDVLAPTTLEYRYLLEDLQYGLVVIEYLGKELGVDMKHMSLVIDLGCALLHRDFRDHDYRITIEQVKEYIALENE